MAVEVTLTFDDQGLLLKAKSEKGGEEEASEGYNIPRGKILSSGMMCRMEGSPCYWCFWVGNRKVCIEVPC